MLQTRDKNAPPLTIICHEAEERGREAGVGGVEDENDIVSGALALNRNRRIEFSLILSSIDPRCDEGAPMLARCSTSQAGIN